MSEEARAAAFRNATRRPRRLEPAFCGLLARRPMLGNIESEISSDGVTHPRGYSVKLSQPVFQGFQNINAVRQAKATVQAGHEAFAPWSRPRF